jgi:hypothetical protein
VSALIDAYGHVGLPRFQNIEDYRAVMATAGIDRAVLCSFDSSPDLAGVHAALTRWPDTFRVLGVPLGADQTEMRAGAEAQLAAGFSGLRLTDADVIDRPWLLELLGRHGRVAVVCGRPSTPETASALVAHLERNSTAIVVGGHFAGADDPRLLESGPVADLFAHPRFHVVFSRHGGYPSALIEEWAAAVVATAGWDRVLWGSESPILYWRGESMQSALDWALRLNPTAEQRAAFFGGNADRLYFAAPVRPEPLDMPFDPWQRARTIPAGVWASGLPVDQSLAGRLVHGWLAAGGNGTLHDYTRDLLDRALPPLPR